MNISIDLGNFWEMLSGLGTFGAVCLSMWIVRKESKVKIRLLLKEELKKNKDNHSSFSNGDSLLKICAYNSGKTTVGIAFIGFGVGTKKKSFSIKNLMKNKKEIKTYIKYVDQIVDIPKLELIEPGRITEEYTIDKLY
ncbi:hypothetical protein HRF80_10035, partial [Enterococcus faecalis]|nr:hypothetical protein [Enterococcus faecalis]